MNENDSTNVTTNMSLSPADVAESSSWLSLQVLGFILAAVAAVLIFVAWRRGHLGAFATEARARRAVNVNVIKDGPDAGAPRRAGSLLRPGRSAEDVLKVWYEDPNFLRDHLQFALDAEGGLDRVRAHLEDHVFDVAEERETKDGKTDTREVEVRVLVLTIDQLKKIPPEVMRELMSRRTRPLVAIATGPSSNGNGAHTNGNGHAEPVPTTSERKKGGARRAPPTPGDEEDFMGGGPQ